MIERTLELASEGWKVIDGDEMHWDHYPSRRTVDVMECARKNAVMPVWGPEPADEKAIGLIVACCVRDDHGFPISVDSFWTASQALAIRLARRIRDDILAEYPDPFCHDQLDLFTEAAS